MRGTRPAPEERIRRSVRRSFAVTLAFALYKAGMGLYLRSPWIGSAAAYYLVLGGIRFSLLRRVGDDLLSRWRRFRLCGGLLLVLTAALGAMSAMALLEGAAIRYPGHLIYGAAAFTFYQLVMAVVNIQRWRKLKDPVYNAVQLLGLAVGLVSLFFLQLSLLAAFGAGGAWERAMNSATGAAVFLLVLGMAVYMMKHGARGIRACKKRDA